MRKTTVIGPLKPVLVLVVLCVATRASQVKDQSPRVGRNSNTKAVVGSSDIDVRFTSADSRLLTESEMVVLRDSLRWKPETVPLSRGGTAASYLVDDKEH